MSKYRAVCFAVLGALVAVALVGRVAPLHADDDGDAAVNHRIFVPESSFTEGVCGFPVRFDPVENRQYAVQTTTEPDGTVIQRITGFLSYRLTNLNTGASVVVNVGGPATVTTRPDGYTALDGEGHTLLTFSHRTQLRLGVPGIDLIDGHTHFVFDPNVTPSIAFTATGHQTDLCAQLA